MILIPKEKPILENLHSYYIDIEKLFEHYQGEVGAGGVHFSSPSAEGVVFFDKDELLDGLFRDKDVEITGQEAIKRLKQAVSSRDFTVNVYEIDPEQVYFWANMMSATKIYEQLSTEFTDLQGLIRKMGSEKLTGFISVSIRDGEEGGLVFLNDGEIIGGSYSWGNVELNHSRENLNRLVEKTKEFGGVFDVSKISAATGSKEGSRDENAHTEAVAMLEELLGEFEQAVTASRKVRTNFDTVLKQKFSEKAEQYDFLDPFEAAVRYAEGRLELSASVGETQLTAGIVETLTELADELAEVPRLRAALSSWSERYKSELAGLDIVVQ